MIEYKATRRLVIVIDVDTYSDEDALEVAVDMLSADGEYDLGGKIIHAIWLKEEDDRTDASPGGGGKEPG